MRTALRTLLCIIAFLSTQCHATPSIDSPHQKRADPAPSASESNSGSSASNAQPSAAPASAVSTASGGGGSTNLNGLTVVASSGNSSQQQASNGNPFQGKPTGGAFPNNVPPAYLTWKKPIPNQTFPPLFKIGVSNITFEWTVDGSALKVQPVNLTVAVANPQKQTSSIQVLAGTATEAFWDLAKIDAQNPLMVGYYTMLVYDQRGPKAVPSPGWLMPDSRLVFALYSTEAYVGRTDSMFCPSCYVGGGRSFSTSALPLLAAFGVAIFTSVFVAHALI
ncbi:hypothetical protein BC940DRAFT_296341 [Gongronella butleri]|nr:hypothetical protein BC940DRAFT_296341 [Gongronella butleri]